MTLVPSTARTAFLEQAAQRILITDGAFGTEIQNWKLTEADLQANENYSVYSNAYERVIERTCTKHAPWWIVPADHKGFRNLITAEILVGTLERMGLAWPEPDPAVLKSEFWKKPI